MSVRSMIGVEGVTKLFEDIAQVSSRGQTNASKAGAKFVVDEAKARAPKDTGKLKLSIKLKLEKSKKGKRVYTIGCRNPELAKISKSGKRSFYPVSQEYGWTTNGKYHKGKPYMRPAIDNNRQKIDDIILTKMASEIDRLR